MKIAIKRNLPFEEARREYTVSSRFTKTHKAQPHGQIKDLTEEKVAMHRNQERQQQNISAMKHILEDMKAIQERMQENMST